MTVCLALDIAMHRTGWAVGGVDWKAPKWGVFETVNWKGNQGKNLLRFASFVENKIAEHGVTVVASEDVFVNVRNNGKAFQFNGTQAQMMLQSAAVMSASAHGMDFYEVDTDHWRLRFVGHNRRPAYAKGDDKYWKDLALKAAGDRGCYCEHHDSAEAIGILDFVLAQLDKSYDARTVRHSNKQELDLMLKRGAHA